VCVCVCVCVCVGWDLVMTCSPTNLRGVTEKKGRNRRKEESVFSVFCLFVLISRFAFLWTARLGKVPIIKWNANLPNAYLYAWKCYLLELPTDRPTDRPLTN
jgi:hypothetical protein